MTTEELVVEIQRADKDEAKDLLEELYLRNERLLRKICRRYAGICDYEDLMQESFLALHRAAMAFDADRGLLFTTLLTTAVKRRLTRFVTENQSAVTIPAHMATKCHQYESARKQLAVDLGRDPAEEEIRSATGFTESQIGDIKAALAARRVASLDTPICGENGTEGTTLGELIPDEKDGYTDILEAQREAELRKIWQLCNGILSDREMQVLQLRYAENKSLSDIAMSMAVSSERIRQIEKTAREKLLQRRRRELVELDEQIFARCVHRARIGTDDVATGNTADLALQLIEKEDRIAQKAFKAAKRQDKRRFMARCDADMRKWIEDAEQEGVEIDLVKLVHIYQKKH